MTCVIAVFATLVIAQVPPVEREGKEWEKLQGKWFLRVMMHNGEKTTTPADSSPFFIKGKKWVRGDGAEIGFLTIDTTTKPALIDLRVTGEGPEKAHRMEGIYEVNKDTLKLCFYLNQDQKKRPTKFPTDPEEGVIFYYCKRATP